RSAAVIDDEKAPRLHAPQHVTHPLPGSELDLDPATVAHLCGMLLEPSGDRGPYRGVHEDQVVPLEPDPPLPPGPSDTLGQGHREVVEQFVGDDHPADPVRDRLADLDV